MSEFVDVASKYKKKLGYAVSELRSNWNDSDWIRGRINSRINGPVQRRILGPGMDIVGAEWDTLLVLDACRADLFEAVVATDDWDDYWRDYSGAGATNRWLERQWSGEYGDIVYVSGSPMVSRHVPGGFHALLEAWQDSIDEELNAPSAEVITEAAVTAHEQYPTKRVIVHYIQPHYPFVHDPDLHFTTFRNTPEWDVEGDDRANDVWEALRRGLVDREQVWAGYQRNLEYVLEHVETLLAEVNGRVVVTSDHGNLLGEWTWPVPFREYGHPAELLQKSLTTVPWAVRDGARREIVDEGAHSRSQAPTEEIENHLDALGYA